MNNVRSLVFISNFLNHHQKPLADNLYQTVEKYYFIETSQMSEERKRLGWGIETPPEYLVSCKDFYENIDEYTQLINSVDVVIIGSASMDLVSWRTKNNKLVFKYSERPLKKGLELYKYPARFIKLHRWYPSNKNVYMLCASAYAAKDYSKFYVLKKEMV